jgi:hypothetical protein
VQRGGSVRATRQDEASERLERGLETVYQLL